MQSERLQSLKQGTVSLSTEPCACGDAVFTSCGDSAIDFESYVREIQLTFDLLFGFLNAREPVLS